MKNTMNILLVCSIWTFLISCSNTAIDNSGQSTPTQNYAQSPTAIYPQEPTLTATRIPCDMAGYGIECSLAFEIPDIRGTGIYSISSNEDLWMVRIEDPRVDSFKSWLLHLTTTGTEKRIPLQVGVTDLLVTDSSIWILNMILLPEKPKLIQLNFDGVLISEYYIPQEMLMSENGQYQEFGLCCLIPAANGGIILKGITGTWQLLIEQGNISPQRLDGLACGQNICSVQNPILGEETGEAIVLIGEKQIMLNTNLDEILLELLSVTPDGGLWVSALEFDRGDGIGADIPTRRYSIHRFNVSGDELGYAIVESPYFFVDVYGNLYDMVIEENGSMVYKVTLQAELP